MFGDDAQVVTALKQPPAPPPFYALSLLYELFGLIRVGVRGLGKPDLRDFSAAAARGTESEDAAFITKYLEDNGDEEGRLERWRTQLSMESNLQLGKLQSMQTAHDELTKHIEELQSKLTPQPLPIPRATRDVAHTPANGGPSDVDSCLRVQEQADMEPGRARRRARRRAATIEEKIEDDLLLELKSALTSIDKRLEVLEQTKLPEQSICTSHHVSAPALAPEPDPTVLRFPPKLSICDRQTSRGKIFPLRGSGSLPESMRSKLHPFNFV